MPESAPAGTIHAVCADLRGRVWVALQPGGVVCVEPGGKTKVFTQNDGLPDGPPRMLVLDAEGAVWIGTREAGLFCYDGTDFTAVPLWPQTILSLKEDREGNMWVGSRGGGLSRVTKRLAELMTTGAGAPHDAIRSVCQDTEGVLWAVVWQKGVVLRNVGQGWTPLSGNEGWSISNASFMTADPEGGIWIGTQMDGVHHWKNGALCESLRMTNGLADNWMSVLLTTSAGELWIGTGMLESPRHFLQRRQAGQFQTYQLPEGSGPIVALTAQPGGDCWAATVGGRLLRVTQVGGECRVESTPGQGVSLEFVVPVSPVVRRVGHENKS